MPIKNKNIIGLASNKVKLLPHNHEWADLYKDEEKIICSAIGKYIKSIQHVGSTSIQGVNSKPIIDIAIGVASLKDAERCVKAMEVLGYEYKYYAEVRGRRFFAKGSRSNRTFYVHMEPIGGRVWKNHILFRDYLRIHEEGIEEYNNVKKLLAKEYKDDCQTYTMKKDPFIKKILKMAKKEIKSNKKAGGIVLNYDRSKIAIIYRANSSDWSFPKGHIEKGETSLIACMREIKEETGLSTELLRELPDMEYEDGAGNMVNLAMYLVQSKEINFIPEHLGNIIKWVDIDGVGKRLSYDNLKEYYEKVLPIIRNNDTKLV